VSGVIAVDLDGTLAEYTHWRDGKIGNPVPLMLARVIDWLEAGERVWILTARVCYGDPHGQEIIIRRWLEEVLGDLASKIERVTSEKTMEIIEMWDDRAVQVIPNTGERADGRR
jgi:hypothetical protein